MKRITAFILLFCLFFMVMGYQLLYYIQLHEARLSMKAELARAASSSDLTTFCFSSRQSAALEWENDHEFSYEGEMYDVVSVTHTDKGQLIRCLPDRRETELERAYMEANGNRLPASAPIASLIKLVNMQFLHPVEAPLAAPANSSTAHFSHYHTSTPLPVKTIHTPPPRP